VRDDLGGKKLLFAGGVDLVASQQSSLMPSIEPG